MPSDVVLGGRKVAVSRPRVRADGREVPLLTFQALAHTDPLNRRVVEHMLVGVATRQYARSLEPLPDLRDWLESFALAEYLHEVSPSERALAAWPIVPFRPARLLAVLDVLLDPVQARANKAASAL